MVFPHHLRLQDSPFFHGRFQFEPPFPDQYCRKLLHHEDYEKTGGNADDAATAVAMEMSDVFNGVFSSEN
jgi:hypothetical protein